MVLTKERAFCYAVVLLSDVCYAFCYGVLYHYQTTVIRATRFIAVTVGVEAATLADGVPVLDILPTAPSGGVTPVMPNKERKYYKATARHSKPSRNT